MTQEEKKEYNKKNYGFLQLKKEDYLLLKAYCKEQGLIMSSFVGRLIKKELKKK